MIRITKQESQEDLDALLKGRPLNGWLVLVQTVAVTTESIYPDFDPVIQGSYLYLKIKNQTILLEILSA
jgi:hypothetical protein